MNFLKHYIKERETVSSVKAQSDVEKNSANIVDDIVIPRISNFYDNEILELKVW